MHLTQRIYIYNSLSRVYVLYLRVQKTTMRHLSSFLLLLFEAITEQSSQSPIFILSCAE